MIVYIAAASREVERFRAAQAALVRMGFGLAHDWLTPILVNLDAGRPDASLSDEEAARHASGCLRALGRSDALWYLCPSAPTKGAYVELGYALGRSIPIVCSGARGSIFEAPRPWDRHGAPLWRLDSDSDAPRALLRVAQSLGLEHSSEWPGAAHDLSKLGGAGDTGGSGA